MDSVTNSAMYAMIFFLNLVLIDAQTEKIHKRVKQAQEMDAISNRANAAYRDGKQADRENDSERKRQMMQ